MTYENLGIDMGLFKDWLPHLKEPLTSSYAIILGLTVATSCYVLFWSKFSQYYRCTGKSRAFMPVPVSRLATSDVICLISLIILKYVLKPIGLVAALKPAADGVRFALPELQLEATLKIDGTDETRYDAATQVRTNSGALPASSPRFLLLPALTTPLMSTLIANRRCPVLAFGSVNTKNLFQFLDPEACRDPIRYLDLSRAIVTGRLGGERLLGRRVKRGMEFDVEIEIKAPRKGSKESRIVFRQIITILAFLPRSTKPLFDSAQSTERPDVTTWTDSTSEALKLDKRAPFRWAAVCADYNPIHVSTIMARLFGFSSTIAHGNHVLAVVLQELSLGVNNASGLGTAIGRLLNSDRPSAIEVQFKRPLLLPTAFEAQSGSSERKQALRVVRHGKEHVVATCSEFTR